MTALRQIIEELESLPPERREQAAQFIRALKDEVVADKNDTLARCFQQADPAVADRMAQAIQEGCEQVDAAGW